MGPTETADQLQRGDHKLRCIVVVEFHIVIIIFQSVLVVSPLGEKQLVGARCQETAESGCHPVNLLKHRKL